MISVYTDENVGPRIIDGLRRRGVHVVTSAEQRMLGATDPEHFTRAMELGAILLTADTDHLALARAALAAGGEHPSVIYFHIAWCDPAEVVRETCGIALAIEPGETRNRIWYVRWTRKAR